MSSHHIVREQQEPALIIANGEACQPDLLHQLLEWSPYIVVLDGALERVLSLGIKIDVVLGDFDRNFDPHQALTQQPHIQIVHTPDQNKTDLEKAIDYLIEHGHQAANIVWATGRRADHTITNITNLVRYRHRIKLNLIDSHSRIYPLPNSFQKWYAQGTVLSLIPIGEVGGIHTQGLVYNLQHEALSLGFRSGNSNAAAADGIVTISYQTGHLLLMECWD
jgi:thiamine pyrophosphokinase